MKITKTVLITGDSGLVGRHVVSTLKNKMRIIGLSRYRSSLDYKTINSDLTKDDLPSISDVDIIIHLAADTECKDKKSAFETNVTGTKKMLELAKRNNVESFVYASSGAVYGFSKKAFKETNKPKPYSFYSKTKYSAELLCKQYSQYFPVVVLRYFFPYGPTDKNRLINRLVNKIRDSEVVELNIAGKPVINPIAVKDAAQATVKAFRTHSQYDVFNIGGKENVSILQLVKIIEDQLDKKATIKYNNKQVDSMLGNTTKSEKMLRFKPRINLRCGIKEIIEKN